MEPLIKVRIPALKVPNGKMKGRLITLNNLSKIHWATLSLAKTKFKESLKAWFLDEWKGNPFKMLEIRITPIRHNKRKLDSDNPILAHKWLMDTLTELKYVDDDCANRLILEPARYEEGLTETMMDIEVKGQR
jgi:hypothetical protein